MYKRQSNFGDQAHPANQFTDEKPEDGTDGYKKGHNRLNVWPDDVIRYAAVSAVIIPDLEKEHQKKEANEQADQMESNQAAR